MNPRERCKANAREKQDVEWSEVQSIVRRPYKDWPFSAHMILSIQDTLKVRAWLGRELSDRIRFAGEVYSLKGPDGPPVPKADCPLHLNIAFTESGLRRLGVSHSDLETFDPAFVEGMAPEPVQPPGAVNDPIRRQGTTRRAGILGDLIENHASNWLWGGIATLPNGDPDDDCESRVLRSEVDILLMVFANQQKEVDAYVRELLEDGTNGVTNPLAKLDPDKHVLHKTFLEGREHFGYRDGLSQPMFPDSTVFKEASDRWREFHQVAAGEFILGYCNERDELPESPTLTQAEFKGAKLPTAVHANGETQFGRLDFGRNGTYLVARQLHQNVGTFDKLVRRSAELIRNDHEKPPLENAAGLLMGRGLHGEPLVPDPGEPLNLRGEQILNAYGFHHTDPAGIYCPIGSHVRRTNPRDALKPNPEAGLTLSKQHRILRRSRMYGDRAGWEGFNRDWKDDKTERGLFFICLNTDIAGQFEFIQDSWINNPNFGDLEEERDAILAASIDTNVSFPSTPITRWLDRGEKQHKNDPRPRPIVEVRGGAYFFMPGRAALDALTRPKNLAPGTMIDGETVTEPLSASDLKGQTPPA